VLQRPTYSLLPRILGSFVALMVASVQGQAPASQPSGPILFRANARTVVVDVVVTDKNGRPAQGLQKEAFQVAEDGHPQKITSFEEHAGGQAPPAARPDLPPNVFTNIPRIKSTGAVTVLLLDGLNTQQQDQSFVRRQMLSYLKDAHPGGRMAIFTLGARLRLVQDFTDDPSVLAEALNNVKRGAGPQTSPMLESGFDKAIDEAKVAELEKSKAPPATVAVLKRFLAEQSASRTDQRVEMTLEALQELAQHLAGIPGRKNVVWFSSAFPLVLFPDPTLVDRPIVQREYAEQLRKTDALLADAQVAIYPVAAQGLATDSLYDVETQVIADQDGTGIRARPGQSLDDDSVQQTASQATMEKIARDTGGQAFYNTNGLSQALAGIEERGSYFYTLSYTPSGTASDGQFRRIQVKLATDNYKLAYRRGYFAADAKADQSAAAKAAGDPLRPLMRLGEPDSTQITFAVRVQVIAAGTEPGHAGDNDKVDKFKGPLIRYHVKFVVAARGLQLDPSADGSRHGSIRTALAAYDSEGKALNWISRPVDLDMNAARYADVEANGVTFHLEIDIPQNGSELRCAVYDQLSHLAGTLEFPLNTVVSSGSTVKGR
jgi:VWFA-related protein